MKIDAHQHFWQISRGDYGWLTPEIGEIYRDFLPADLTPILKDAGIDGTIWFRRHRLRPKPSLC